MERRGRRRALVLVLPLVLAFGWLGWRLGAGPVAASSALERQRALEPPPRAQSHAEALEVPERESTGERLAGTSEAFAQADHRGDGPPGRVLEADVEEPLAGAIRGELLREGGPWTEATLPKPGSVLLDLVPSAGPKHSRRAQLASEPDGRGGLRLRFEFASLPRGEYELTLSSLSTWRWNPTSLRVSPPIDNITFLRYDLDRCSPLVFRVTDRSSGAPIEHFDLRALRLTPSQDNGVFLHTGPLETAAVPDDLRFQWSLWAEGYRPVFGDENSFERRNGARVAEIALDRGWATKALVLMRDPSLKPALRVEVLCDGRSIGFTGEDGMLALAAEKPPERIEVRLPGWKMLNDPLQPYEGRSAAQRGQVTIVMLEKAP